MATAPSQTTNQRKKTAPTRTTTKAAPVAGMEEAIVCFPDGTSRAYHHRTDIRMPRYCAAMRVSTKNQESRKFTESQWLDIVMFLGRQHSDGYAMVARLDETRSGAAEDLTALFKLIQQAKQTSAKLVVSKSDRLYRSGVNEQRIHRYLERNGVELLIADGLPDFLRPIMAGIAGMERNLIGNRVRATMAHRKRRGLMSYKELNRGVFTAAGIYRGIHTKRIKAQARIDKHYRAIVRLRQEGKSLRQIVESMSACDDQVTYATVWKVCKQQEIDPDNPGYSLNAQTNVDVAYAAEIAMTKQKEENIKTSTQQRMLIRLGYSMIYNSNERPSVSVASNTETPEEVRQQAKRAYEQWLAGIYHLLHAGKRPYWAERITNTIIQESGDIANAPHTDVTAAIEFFHQNFSSGSREPKNELEEDVKI